MNWHELKSDPLPPAVSYDDSCIRCGDPTEYNDAEMCYFCEQTPFCLNCYGFHNCDKRYDEADDTPERAGE